jgi:hypothetical protein
VILAENRMNNLWTKCRHLQSEKLEVPDSVKVFVRMPDANLSLL